MGVAGTGRAALDLARGAARGLEAGAPLSATEGDGWLVVLGEVACLPWADGAVYLGWQSGVLYPTTMTTDPHPDLVARAVRAAVGAGPDDLVVLLDGRVLVGPRPASTADPAKLNALHEGPP